MEYFIDLLKILTPASIVLYACFLMVRSFLNARLLEINQKIISNNITVSLPIRLQAYERMALFLERIKPNNLIGRVNNSDLTIQEYQHILIHEIRSEFNHNLSQQIYMSNEVWEQINIAIEDLVSNISDIVHSMDGNNKSFELAKLLIQRYSDKNSIQLAIYNLKNEIKELI